MPTLQHIICNHIVVRFDLFSEATLSEKWLAIKYVRHAFNYLDKNFPDWEKDREGERRKNDRLAAYVSIFYPNLVTKIRIKRRTTRRALRKKNKNIGKQQNLQQYTLCTKKL